MKIFTEGKRINILKAKHHLLLEKLESSGIIINSKLKPKIGHINIDGFSIRTILKSNNDIINTDIFKKIAFPKKLTFKYASNEYFNNSTMELNRVRSIHRLIYKTIPVKIRDLKLKLTTIDRFSVNYKKKLAKIQIQLKKHKQFLKELKTEFKTRKKIAYHVSNILIPSFYIIHRKKEGLIQAKWLFLGKEQKRIHLGMFSKLNNYSNKKLRNMAIKIIRKKYKDPFDKLTYTWIEKERKRLKKWKININQKNKIYS